jgi:hypothetical protein
VFRTPLFARVLNSYLVPEHTPEPRHHPTAGTVAPSPPPWSILRSVFSSSFFFMCGLLDWFS